MKGIETDLGNLPWNKEVKAEPLYASTGLISILQCLKARDGGREAGREGEMGGERGTESLPLNQFLLVNIKHLHSLWPTPLANVSATSLCELNMSVTCGTDG